MLARRRVSSNGFSMKSNAPDLDRRHRHIDVAVAGDQDDRPGEASRIEMANQIETGHARHAHVRDDAIELLRAIDGRENFFRRIKARGLDFLARKIKSQGIRAPPDRHR